jgi:uncharacterized protein YbjT (DUF2867 family)
MRIVVIGGTGLIGHKVVRHLTERGFDVHAASLSTGVNLLTGNGLQSALSGASVVADVSDVPTHYDQARHFFETVTANLLYAEASVGVAHHVALSIVNSDQLAIQDGYFRCKFLQEVMISRSPIPYTIVHATPFFEYVHAIADAASDDDTVRLPSALVQPIAARDAAEAVAIAATGTPLNHIVEVAGPRRYRLDELVRTALTAWGDRRPVVTCDNARVWGVLLQESTLIPRGDAAIFDETFEDWTIETAGRGRRPHSGREHKQPFC